MSSGTTTQSCYQLDMVLNALWHNERVLLSAGLGIECPLALPHSPVISWVWYIECPLALPHSPVTSKYNAPSLPLPFYVQEPCFFPTSPGPWYIEMAQSTSMLGLSSSQLRTNLFAGFQYGLIPTMYPHHMGGNPNSSAPSKQHYLCPYGC